MNTRRDFIRGVALLTPALLIPGAPVFAKEAEKKGEDVSPGEDLMREHGVLNRILLIYEEGLRRINSKQDFNPEVLNKAAVMIRDFIEGYHEKLEEEFIFPRLKKAGKLTDTVDILAEQHKAGRKVTTRIEKLSNQAALKLDSDRHLLVHSLEQFIKMYRPHESREDTVVFPALHALLTEKEYDAMGDQFEDREHQLFGQEGFEGVVPKVAELEKSFGIYDLAQFTPKDLDKT